MNDTITDLDQTEEETLNLFTCEASDEELETAAGGMRAASSLYSSFAPAGCTCRS